MIKLTTAICCILISSLLKAQSITADLSKTKIFTDQSVVLDTSDEENPKIILKNLQMKEVKTFLQNSFIEQTNIAKKQSFIDIANKKARAKDNKKDFTSLIMPSNAKPNQIVSIELPAGNSIDLDALKYDGNEKITITIGNGKKVTGKKESTFIIKVNKAVAETMIPPNVSNRISGGFIPTNELEAKWMTMYYSNALIPPALNKHTRWAITYDYTKQDPVAVWRRTNKVAGTTCDGNIGINSKINKKNKSLSGIARDIYSIDTALNNLQKNTTDFLIKKKLDPVRASIDSIRKAISSEMTEDELNKVSTRLQELKNNINIIQILSPTGNNAFEKTKNLNTSASNCCDVIYCVKQSKRLAPTVGRDLLLSVTNYHPYRDSLSVSIEYNDQFIENAAVFTSTFTGLKGSSGGSTGTTKTDTKDNPKIDHQDSDSKTVSDAINQRFIQLAKELKEYYNGKYEQANLDVRTVENGVSYIKSKMTELLGITEFTEAGIVKRGEDLSDSVKKQNSNTVLNDYFKVVREAASWFSKVASYRRFDSKSILVQNKDIISITLNRYRDGRLLTIPNEALRPYHTSGGFKMDFSLGIFGSSLINRMFTTMPKATFDTSFFAAPNGVINRDSVVHIDTVQRRQIIKDKQGNFEIGPAVFVHGYFRTGLDVNIGGTFGLSINQSADIRYLYGVSLLFGKDNRFVLSVGGISGKVKDLSSSYKENQIIDPLTENSGAVPTKDVTRAGWFAGISFNFGGFTIGNH